MASKFITVDLKALIISLLVLCEVILGLGEWRHYMGDHNKHFVLISEHIAK